MHLDPSALAVSIAAGMAAGVVGCFAVMRRMTLAADAISHVALPGIGIAIALRIHPVLGALAMLVVGTFLVWAVERKTRLATETIVGVVFSAALAVGSMVTSGDALLEALFGGQVRWSRGEVVIGVAVAVFVVVAVLRDRHRLVLALVSPEIARTTGVNVARLELRFLMLFALTVAVGLRYLGVLLIGSLVIVPAATAKRLATSLHGMLLISVVVAVFATTVGSIAASALRREVGPLVVVVASACFFVSLLRPAR